MASPPLLPRRQLLHRLEQALEGRLVRVCAGAGAGKSTLIRLATHRWQREVVHVRLDHRSGDASFFFWQLLDALGLAGDDLMPTGSTPPETVGAIAEELARRPPCVIALDEAEMIRTARPVLDIIARLARQAPTGTSVLVLSRDPLALPLDEQDPVHDLDERDLALGADEIATLLRDVAPGAEPTAAQLETLAELTRGRALLVHLFALAARRTSCAHLLTSLETTARPVDVLLDQVLLDFTPDEVAALESAAVLDALVPEVARVVAGGAVSWENLLAKAAARSLIDGAAEPPMFPRSISDALLRKLEARPDALRLVHARAASALRDENDPERVLHHLIEAGDVDEAVKVLITEGLAIITFNRILALERLLERLPEDRVAPDPVLRFARGTVRIVNMDIRGALDDLRAAAESAETAGIPDIADAARVRLGLTVMFQGDFEASVTENRIVSERRGPDDAIGILAFANLEMGLRYLGRDDEADPVALRLDASPVDYPDRLPVLGCRTFVARLRGDGAAQRALGLQGAAAARKHRAPGGLCFLLLHVSEGALRLGHADEALEVADEATAICRSMREHWWELVSRQARLCALVELGRIDEARREAREIVAACDTYGGLLWTRAEAALVLAELPGEDPDDALEVARESADRTTHPVLRAQLRIALARRSLAKGALAEAHKLLDDARRELGTVTARDLLQSIQLVRAQVQLREGHSKLARETLTSQLRAGPGLRREREALLPVLAALALDGDEAARAQVIELGTRSLPHLARRRSKASDRLRDEILEARAGPLDVRSLGGFEVMRRGAHGQPDLRIEFRTPRVAQIFRWLVARTERGASTASDTLIDRLWPEQSPAPARKSLHTHLSWLRDALEPDLPHRGGSRYLQRDEAGYRLDLRGGTWDGERFRRLAESGLLARRMGDTGRAEALLAEALPVYRGPLFADTSADDMLAEKRAELARLFCETSLAAARLALEHSKPDVARVRLERLLAEDASVEAAWVGLMQATAALERPEEIPRLLARCRDALQRELDAEPSPETEAIAAHLGSPRAARAPASPH